MKKKLTRKTCEACGLLFDPTGPRQRYCTAPRCKRQQAEDAKEEERRRNLRKRIMANAGKYPMADDKIPYWDAANPIYAEHSWSGFDPLPPEKDPLRFRRRRKKADPEI